MYELARGPLLWLSAVIFIVGTSYRIAELFKLTEKRERIPWPKRGVRLDSPEERKLRPIVAFQHSLIGRFPIMALVTGMFHFCLFAGSIFAPGHAQFLRQSWHISFWSLPSSFVDVLTILVLLAVLFMLVRRIALPRVRAVTSFNDYLFLFIAAAPYLSGFMAYHQFLHYRTLLIIHMMAGELMLIAMPFTKLSHMIFFFFARSLVGSEHNIARGGRVWSA
jgi:nitrate reductase gamma subunit